MHNNNALVNPKSILMNSSHITAQGTTSFWLLSQRKKTKLKLKFCPCAVDEPCWFPSTGGARRSHISGDNDMCCIALTSLWVCTGGIGVKPDLGVIKAYTFEINFAKQLRIATWKLCRFWDILSSWHGLILNLYNLPRKFWNIFRIFFKL